MKKKSKYRVLLLLALLAALYPFAGVVFDRAKDGSPRIYNEVELLDTTSDLTATDPIGEIGPGRFVRQTFLADEEALVSVEFIVVTYNRVNEGTIVVRLLDADDSSELYVWEEDISGFSTGSVVFTAEQGLVPQMETGTPYMIEITTTGGTPGNAISVLVTREDRYPGGMLNIDGQTQKGDLCFAVIGADDSRSLTRTKLWMRLYAAGAAELLLAYLYVRARRSPEAE